MTEDGYCYSIRLNADHVIFKAHFPGEPITPGVCILQMSIELLSESVGKKLEPVYVKNVKFISLLTPDIPLVKVLIHNIVRSFNEVRAQIEFTTAGHVISKISIVCRTIS